MSKAVAEHLFSYDPGEPFAIRWKNPPPKASKVKTGQLAGHWHRVHSGSSVLHRFVIVDGARFSVHTIVWLMHTGNYLPRKVHFKDAGPSDCRITNLGLRSERPRKTYTAEEKAFFSDRWRERTFTKEEWSQYIRSRNLRLAYGITTSDYLRMYHAQKGVCAICKQPETLIRRGKPEKLAVDHCHATKKTRGLLCHQCNNGLGRFKDSPEILEAAAAYLRQHAQPPALPVQVETRKGRRRKATAAHTVLPLLDSEHHSTPP